MSTIPHTAFSSAREAGVWDDVSSVVQALGSALEPSQLCAAIREVLAERSGTPVEVFLIEPQNRSSTPTRLFTHQTAIRWVLCYAAPGRCLGIWRARPEPLTLLRSAATWRS